MQVCDMQETVKRGVNGCSFPEIALFSGQHFISLFVSPSSLVDPHRALTQFLCGKLHPRLCGFVLACAATSAPSSRYYPPAYFGLCPHDIFAVKAGQLPVARRRDAGPLRAIVLLKVARSHAPGQSLPESDFSNVHQEQRFLTSL